MTTLKIIEIGNSEGVILPKELLAKLNLAQGDVVYATDAPDGMRLTAHDPEFVEQMRLADRVAKDRRNVLAALA